ncbi:hypothetical protein [Agathobaculum sp.]|nr:hypothetical protein [Agathobaculum sp.]MDY3617776.1 hypothetical protein [Agathobaculum sp.]
MTSQERCVHVNIEHDTASLQPEWELLCRMIFEVQVACELEETA